jgi:regulation of enolase protein 1 (concanavalin A-like superfamily)
MLEWAALPVDWSIHGDAGLSISAGEKTDLFIDPAGTARKESAPAALFVPPDQAFLLHARVKVAFAATYDAGMILIRCANDCWGKLCFERSPQGENMIVSVVTRGVSDDCNSVPVPADTVWLRIAQTRRTTAFHYSLDGKLWSFVRYFSLGSYEGLRTGLSGQSPTGNGCRSEFSEISYKPGTLADLRSGV